MKRILAAFAMSLVTTAAYGATVQPLTITDREFSAQCNVLDCEVAVAEIRAGDLNGRAEKELDARAPGRVFGQNAKDLRITPGASLLFSLMFDPLSELLTFTVDGTSTSADTDMESVSSLFIRHSSRGGGAISITGMELNGHEIGNLSGDGISYLQVGGIDFTDTFELTGTFMFDVERGDRLRSNMASQFKFTDLAPPPPAPIPLPAGAWLILGGLGALTMVRRRFV